MAAIRDVDAAWYVTFHHKGVVEGHDAFVQALDAFAAVVDRRDDAIVDYCTEPRTIADMAEHRFLYRPHVELPWVASAERRTAEQHVDAVGGGRPADRRRRRLRARLSGWEPPGSSLFSPFLGAVRPAGRDPGERRDLTPVLPDQW